MSSKSTVRAVWLIVVTDRILGQADGTTKDTSGWVRFMSHPCTSISNEVRPHSKYLNGKRNQIYYNGKVLSVNC